MKPSIGRIVHYVSYGTPGGEYGKECRAAIVTEVTETEVNERNPAGDGVFREAVGLCVLNPTGLFLNRGVLRHEGVPFDDEHPELAYPGGTWHWPERVSE
jgi:hypothetical protein